MNDDTWTPGFSLVMGRSVDRLIDNAFRAYVNCKNNNSEWGTNYWQMVITTLLRKYNKVH